MAWDVQFREGLWLPQVGWWLDARFPTERCFVSHAHFDHLAAHREILCSPGTAQLLSARLRGDRREHRLPFGQTEPLTEDTTVTLHPAGHIWGSAQILLEHAERGRLLYTGDFKLRPGLSAEPCATPGADVLIMETTYGLPRYVFPPTADVLADVLRFCHQAIEDAEVPVLFGYSLGKSQEILQGLASARLPIMLHPQAHRLTEIYRQAGQVFPPYRLFAREDVAGHVVISPPQSPQSPWLRQITPRRTAALTGWALDPGASYRYQCDVVFPLSDHADFPDLLAFVDRVRPRRVLTLHGFAAEFAQTLRARGYEAWALGRDNQLELGLASPATAMSRAAPFPAPEPAVAGPADFSRFAATADAIRDALGKLQKVELLSAYLRSLSTEDAGHAALFFTGRPFAQSADRTLNLGWATIKRAVLEAGQLREADYRATYHRFADSGDAAAALLAGRTRPQPCSLAELAAWWDEVASARGPLAKLARLQERLATLSAVEIKYLIKIMGGDLRIGLKTGLVEEAIAAATTRPLEDVRTAHLLCGDIGWVMRAASTDQLASIGLRVFHPLQFMLASPEPTVEALLARLPPPVWLEEKYDGIRCQLHKQGERVELFSRDLHRITDQFPDLAVAARQLRGDFIVDGELLAWREDRPLPFAELQKRLGRQGDDFFLGQEIPVSLSCYDLLWVDGRTLLSEPLRVRRAELERLLAPPPGSSHPVPRFRLTPVQHAAQATEVEAAFLAARRQGHEGLLAKNPASPYQPGRRGLAWIKLKRAQATLDVVVVRVEYGHGKRRDVLSDYTFAIRDETDDRLLTIGKAYSGLTDEEIATLTTHFLENTLAIKGRQRHVVPTIVLEIAFDAIQPSSRHESGLALRFPRIARIRTDKTPADIDTLATCRQLAGLAPRPLA